MSNVCGIVGGCEFFICRRRVQTMDMGGMVPVGGMPVVSPAGTMLSPGTHSPGPPTGNTLTAPSPAHPQANVPSPGSASNTPGWLISTALHAAFHFTCVDVLFHERSSSSLSSCVLSTRRRCHSYENAACSWLLIDSQTSIKWCRVIGHCLLDTMWPPCMSSAATKCCKCRTGKVWTVSDLSMSWASCRVCQVIPAQ